jgi:hypothetical protein
MFKTLGNFLSRPIAGVCFVDFDGARQLQLTGDVHIQLDQQLDEMGSGGTGRWWSFSPRRWAISPLAMDGDWELVSASPFNP